MSLVTDYLTVAIPPGAAAGEAHPGGPLALWPMLPCRLSPPVRWLGRSPRSPDRSASAGRRCGPGLRTGSRSRIG